MHWFTAFLLFVMTWWTVLFAVLPFGTRPRAEADPVTGWRGAPAQAHIGRKVLATTIVTAILWGAMMVVITQGWVSFRAGWLASPEF